MFQTGINQSDGPAWLSVTGASLGSALSEMLLAGDIVPGSQIGYQLAKTIYSYHVLGPVLADAPITRAQARSREISVPVLAESRVVEQFNRTFNELSKVGATVVLHNLHKTSRIYGIASLAVGERDKDPGKPLVFGDLADADLYFNVLDPLNTSGSLVMNQDPNSPDFLKPSGEIHVNGKPWHPSRLFVKMHEQPLYIEWSPSAFGFVGRSVYQRPLYALKTFLQSMITDQMVTRKAGLLVAKMESPGSAIDNVMQAFFGLKRSKIKEGVTNEVLQVGIEESIETLNMQNLDKAASFARTNVLKNVATACGMPASLIAQETLTEGFGEGTEDAKKEAGYLDYVRLDMQPSYDFVDRIVMRKAWTQEFYETLFPDYPEYKTKPFHTSLHEWMRAFSATWPNLLVEPDSEKAKTQDVKMKAVIAMVEVLSPELDAQSEASLLAWAAENANEAKELFSGKLDIDTDALLEHLQAKSVQPQSGVGEEEEKEPEPRPFTIAS